MARVCRKSNSRLRLAIEKNNCSSNLQPDDGGRANPIFLLMAENWRQMLEIGRHFVVRQLAQAPALRCQGRQRNSEQPRDDSAPEATSGAALKVERKAGNCDLPIIKLFTRTDCPFTTFVLFILLTLRLNSDFDFLEFNFLLFFFLNFLPRGTCRYCLLLQPIFMSFPNSLVSLVI